MHMAHPSMKWSHHHHYAHTMSSHDMLMPVNKLLHDSRFWTVFALVAFLAVLITVAVVSAGSTAGSDVYRNYYPYGIGF